MKIELGVEKEYETNWTWLLGIKKYRDQTKEEGNANLGKYRTHNIEKWG